MCRANFILRSNPIKDDVWKTSVHRTTENNRFNPNSGYHSKLLFPMACSGGSIEDIDVYTETNMDHIKKATKISKIIVKPTLYLTLFLINYSGLLIAPKSTDFFSSSARINKLM